jgi:hypothetical protein
LTPRAHDSGVQGLGDSDIDPASGRGEGNQKGTKNRRKRKEKHEYVLPEIGVDGEEEQAVMFRGIADADSSEERWTQIVLEEHMDKIFNAVPKPLSEEEMGKGWRIRRRGTSLKQWTSRACRAAGSPGVGKRF